MEKLNDYIEQVIIAAGKIRHFLARTSPAWFPGVLAGLILFIYAIIANMSLSYMGNTSKDVMEIIFANYKSLVSLFFLKILFSYLLIGMVLSTLVHLVVSVTGRGGLSNRAAIALNTGITLLLFILQFCKHCIQYPQLYIDTFYTKNFVFRSAQEFLTNNFSPGFFTFIQLIIILTGVILAAIHVFKRFTTRFPLVFSTLNTNMSPSMQRSRLVLVPVSLLLILIISMVFFLHGKQRKTQQPNIIILASDALRPDRFSGFGYGKATTPSIDRLIENGTSVDGVYTTVPRTFPAWVSILTSQYPIQHGITHMFPRVKTRQHRQVTLADILAEKGYRTSAFGDFAADIFPRIDLGFQHVHTPTFNARIMIKQVILKNHMFLLPFLTGDIGRAIYPCIREYAEFADPEIVTSDIIGEINTQKRRGNPFFITGFYSVTHFPYPAPWPYYNMFTDTSYSGPYKYSKQRIVSLDNTGSTGQNTSEEDIVHISALYDGCLHAFDNAVGKIVQHLSEEGLLDNTIILITSDHGENLYESGFGMGHGEHLRGEYSIKVPCVLHGPGIPRGKHISSIRSIIDMAPTLCRLSSTAIPASFEGTPLFPPLTGDTGNTATKNAGARVHAYMETGIWFDNTGDHFFQEQRVMYPGITGMATVDLDHDHEIVITPYYDRLVETAKHRSIVYNGFKLIYIPTRNGILYELYDLDGNDPHVDISSRMPGMVTFLKKKLFSLILESGNYIIENDYIFRVK